MTEEEVRAREKAVFASERREDIMTLIISFITIALVVFGVLQKGWVKKYLVFV